MADESYRSDEAGSDGGAEAASDQTSAVRVRSVARACQILAIVAKSENGLTALEIARTGRLPVQATYHLIHTLVSLRLLARNQRRAYILGLGIAPIAEAFHRQLSPPPELIELVRRVTQETGETAYACGWVDGEIVVLHVNRGNRPVQVSDVARGSFDHAHARASGKLLLAYCSRDAQTAYLATHPLRSRTRKTITDTSELMRELADVKQLGYAVDEEEFLEGVCCLAVPADPAGAYSLTISAPRERYFDGKERYIKTMKQIALG